MAPILRDIDFPAILARVVTLLTAPRRYWEDANSGPGDIKRLMCPQMLVLAALPTLAHFVGHLVGPYFPGGFFVRLFHGIVALLFLYPLLLGLWILFAFIIDALGPTFGATRNIQQSTKLATGAVIPLWLGSVLGITGIPALAWLGSLAGLGYGGYLLYLGIPMLTGTAKETAPTYAVAAMICLLLSFALLVMLPVSCVSWFAPG